MKIVERYILKEWLLNLMGIFFILLFLYILADVLSHTDEIIRSKTPLLKIIIYYFYTLPSISISLLFPLSTLMSSSFSLTSLMRSQQILSLRSAGLSYFEILKPLGLALLLISLFFIYFTENHLQTFNQRCQELKSQVFGGSLTEKETIENITYLSSGGELIYIRRLFPEKGKAQQMLIINQKNLSKFQAQKGVYKDGRWHLYDVYLHNLLTGKIDFYPSTTLKLVEPSKLLSQKTLFFEIYPQRLIREKIDYFKNLDSPELARLWELESHKKFAICFFSLFLNLSLWGLFLRMRKKHYLLSNFAIGIFLSFLFYLLFSLSTALGKAGVISPGLSVWFIPTVFSIWGILNILSLP